jgi:hypothetical protein
VATYLVCEGGRGSLDERVLDVAVIQPHGLAVLTAPTGGDKGLGAVRAYLQHRTPGDVAIAVQDRNFFPFADAHATWSKMSGTSFTWRRHEIENYLLHPRLIVELVKSLSRIAWTTAPPATEAGVEVLLQSLAEPLIENHAAEVLRTEIVQVLNTIGSVSYGPRKPAPSSGMPLPGQAEWKPALVTEATRLRLTCDAVAKLPNLDGPTIEARYHAILTPLQSPAFLSSGDYLRDLGGHELMKALARDFRDRGAPAGFTDTFLAEELLRLFPSVYQPNNWFAPDDFAELAAILAQY